jgi:hypothetical protein
MPGPEFPDPNTPPGYNVDPPYPTTSVNPEVQELVEEILDDSGECPIPGEQCGP